MAPDLHVTKQLAVLLFTRSFSAQLQIHVHTTVLFAPFPTDNLP